MARLAVAHWTAGWVQGLQSELKEFQVLGDKLFEGEDGVFDDRDRFPVGDSLFGRPR